ncbi:MAG: tetratricopeptide repeat protein, partial [Bacteroidales bacterium]|nr:tetratricopeptide repeat protein [Bacteroidales bacterium]
MKAILSVFISFVLPFLLSATPLAYSKASGRLWKNISSQDKVRLDNYLSMSQKNMGSKSKESVMIASAYLDSAYMLCEKKRIDCPALLHLLKADLYSQSRDYTRSEEEAKIALEKAESSKEYDIQAKAMLFLGRYYRLTGFYKESIDFFTKSIALAKKHNLKGIIPQAYHSQAEIYQGANDYKSHRLNLELMIEAAYAENDTSM